MLDYSFLQVVWWVLVIVLLSGFAIFDGFDLGALTLNPFVAKTDAERRTVINTIAPHWDGNQVWLLTGGGAIFAAWPEVYATAFSGFFLAMVLILAALFFRPVGLEYRGKFEAESHRRGVDWSLAFSGFVPALVVGVALGNVLQGVPFTFDAYGRSHYGPDTFFLLNLLKLLNPFALVTGLLSLCVFLLQGAAWIMLRVEKTTDVYQRTKKVASTLALAVLVLFVVVVAWLTQVDAYQVVNAGGLLQAAKEGDVVVAGTWFANFNAHPVLYVLPVAAFVLFALVFKSVAGGNNGLAFVFNSVAILLLFATFATSLFPAVLPSSYAPHHTLTVWNATASQNTLTVMFFVAIVITPVVLCYTAWCYYKMWVRLSPEAVVNNTHALY